MNQVLSKRPYAPSQSSGCISATFSAVAVFLLTLAGGAIYLYHPAILKAVDDYRRLPARVQALEESVRSTNETFTKYLKP